ALKFPLLESHLFCFSLAAIGDALPFSSFTKRTLDHITGKQPVKYSELKPLVLLFLLPFIFLTIQNIT
ncbi:MAG: hypothetical protein KDK65_08000, partial [Chlamydiia bacterium]|nr:hypothetical protein [Chlamydiia bacterium]